MTVRTCAINTIEVVNNSFNMSIVFNDEKYIVTADFSKNPDVKRILDLYKTGNDYTPVPIKEEDLLNPFEYLIKNAKYTSVNGDSLTRQDKVFIENTIAVWSEANLVTELLRQKRKSK